MAKVPIDYRKFNPNTLQFSDELEKRQGYLFSAVLNAENKETRNRIQTPKMECIGVTSDYIDFSFLDTHDKFYKALIRTNEKIKGVYMENSEKWTKKKEKVTPDTLSEDFRSPITPNSKELKGLPLFRVYFSRSSNGQDNQTLVFNQHKDALTPEHLAPGLQMICIIELSGIRMKKNYVTPLWEVKQIKMYTNKNKEIKGYAFLDESDDLKSIAMNLSPATAASTEPGLGPGLAPVPVSLRDESPAPPLYPLPVINTNSNSNAPQSFDLEEGIVEEVPDNDNHFLQENPGVNANANANVPPLQRQDHFQSSIPPQAYRQDRQDRQDQSQAYYHQQNAQCGNNGSDPRYAAAATQLELDSALAMPQLSSNTSVPQAQPPQHSQHPQVEVNLRRGPPSLPEMSDSDSE